MGQQQVRNLGMNTWVEYWDRPEDTINNHAQMKTHLKWKEPEPEMVSTRYFPDKKTAMEFCTALNREDKYYTRIKTDGNR